MDETDVRVVALTSSPAGCAFLSWVKRLDMSAADAADPLMSCFLVGRALDDVNVWRVDREEAVQNYFVKDLDCYRWHTLS